MIIKRLFIAAALCLPLVMPAPSGVLPQADAAASTVQLMLWPPSHVESKTVTLVFDYTAASAGKLRAELKFKRTGTATYQKATLGTQALAASASGQQTYRIVWNKAADKVAEGKSVDLSLTVTDAKGKATAVQLSNYKTEPKPALSSHVNNYMIYYGQWTDAMIDLVKKRYDMAIVNTKGITPRQAARLRAGVNPADASDDVLLLGYISVGEDERTQWLNAGADEEGQALCARWQRPRG
ncbi:hypothetical protein GON22_16945 [Paenibacillus sp. MMS18-CY102]|nr:hypothetical protein [Paenibacillus sp. MMS18-CY102]